MTRLRLVVALVLASRAAFADQPPPPVRHIEVQEPPRTQGDDLVTPYTSQPYLGLRIFPIRLIGGVGQIGAELRLLEKLTILPQFGYGRVLTKNPLTSRPQRQAYTEVEVYGRYYPIGGIGGGLYTSAGISHAIVDTDQLIASPLMNLSAGTHALVALGGNYLFPLRLTIDLQFLFAYRMYQPTPSQQSPPEQDRAAALRIGVALALGYLF